MKVWKKTNKGIVLLFILVVGVVIYCLADTAKFASRKQAAYDKAVAFTTDLSALYTWPKDMPQITVIDIEKNEKKYYPYLDAGLAKVKPYIFGSDQLSNELKKDAMNYIKELMLDDLKPEQVTFTPAFTKTQVQKNTATVKGTINIKARLSDGKYKNKSLNCLIMLEYQNDDWVVVCCSAGEDSYM